MLTPQGCSQTRKHFVNFGKKKKQQQQNNNQKQQTNTN